MAGWSIYLIVYLFGAATPVIVVRNLIRNNEDGGSCLLDIVLWGMAGLIVMVAWLGVSR